MHVPEWLVNPFDIKIDNKGHEPDIQDERIEMYGDLEAKVLFKSKYLANC